MPIITRFCCFFFSLFDPLLVARPTFRCSYEEELALRRDVAVVHVHNGTRVSRTTQRHLAKLTTIRARALSRHWAFRVELCGRGLCSHILFADVCMLSVKITIRHNFVEMNKYTLYALMIQYITDKT